MGKNDQHGILLKKNGLKTTKHRISILDYLDNSGCPATADDIFLDLVKHDISINLSSVYRILEALSEKGIINRIYIKEGTRSYYDLKRPEHRHYLVCSGCSKVLPVKGCPLVKYEKQIGVRLGFEVEGHDLQIYGLRRDCKVKK